MKIILAGYNLDINLLQDYKTISGEVLTPETISSAYARISRYSKSVDELRRLSIHNITKARNSNQRIIFEMGHSSIAEHSVFNFDLIGISRYITEFIQRSRLVSFTEKSQRYITLYGDFVLPPELVNYPIKQNFINTIEQQNQTYLYLYDKLKEYFRRTLCNNYTRRAVDEKAKQDARYVVCLSTETQMGITINARNLERLLKRLFACGLTEGKIIADKMYNQVKNIAPSLVRYIIPSEFDKRNSNFCYSNFKAKEGNIESIFHHAKNVQLLDYDEDGDDKILSAILFRNSYNGFQKIKENLRNKSVAEKKELFKEILQEIKSFDPVPREFELADFTFQILCSASCFAQLKRHRMSTIISAPYHPDFGYTIPQSIEKIDEKKKFIEIMNVTNETFYKIQDIFPRVAPYILTNAHRRSVIFKLNVRELYHFSRLREDTHSQWEIRNIAEQIVRICKDKLPLSTMLVCGKDQFENIYSGLYGSTL
ncbi:MAG: thymidylate synthase (FAD) [Candidatus Cloacimonadota bacterium]|nr:MAG: thymidylate synthase (FAD) [Candidatus Cloacimonadota bacterium]